MCLTAIDTKIKRQDARKNDEVVVAYGVFEALQDGRLIPQYYCCYKVVEDTWMQARPRLPRLSYYAGFHKYATKQAAVRASTQPFVVRKVYLRHVRAVGRQNEHKVIVAEQMFIPSSAKVTKKIAANIRTPSKPQR